MSKICGFSRALSMASTTANEGKVKIKCSNILGISLTVSFKLLEIRVKAQVSFWFQGQQCDIFLNQTLSLLKVI